MKIKLLVVEYTHTYYDYEDIYKNDIKPLSEWIEVSEEEYILLNDESIRKGILDTLIPKNARNYNQSLIILTDITPSSKKELLNSIDGLLKSLKAKKEADERKAKIDFEKRKKAEQERKKKAEQRKIDNARKILEKAGEL
jgi:hypothetical protein